MARVLVTVMVGLVLGLGAVPAVGDEVSAPPAPTSVTSVTPPTVTGTARYDSVLTASPGSWDPAEAGLTYRWLRNGTPIGGATFPTYRLKAKDIGLRVAVRVTATAPDLEPGVAVSATTVKIKRKVPQVRTKPSIAGTRRFGRTLTANPGRWSVPDLRFSYRWFRDGRTISGATRRTYTLQPGDVGRRIGLRVVAKRTHHKETGVSSPRTGEIRHRRDVIINETCWRSATSPWNRAGGSLRGYRHMVVNHESGHFLGKGHARCAGKGRAAPVMMQQSKGLASCRFNPWPTLGELGSV